MFGSPRPDVKVGTPYAAVTRVPLQLASLVHRLNALEGTDNPTILVTA